MSGTGERSGPPRAAVVGAAVVGAGVSGLAAAVRLLDLAAAAGRRLDVRVFEAGEPGGGCRTLVEEHAGQRVVRELGPDSFLSKPPHLVRFCERVGLGGDLIGTNDQPRGALVWHAGRTERVPAGFRLLAPAEWGPTLRSRTLNPLQKARLLTEPLRTRGGGEDESIGAFVRRRLGRGVLDRLAQPLAAGIYAGDVDRLSLRACLPQFAADEAARGRVTGAKPAAGERPGDGGARYALFVTPADGVAAIPAAAVRVLDEADVSIRTGAAVRSLARGEAGWSLTFADGSAETADAVILAAAGAGVSGAVRGASAELADELDAIEFASSAVVNTLHDPADVAHPLDAFGLVVPETDRAAARARGDGFRGTGGEAFAVSFAHRKFPGRGAPRWVQLRTFLGGFGMPEVASRPDADLLDAARRELARLLGVRWTDRAGETARVGRWVDAMPQYHVGHLARVARIERLLADLPGLELAGNALHGVGLPAATKSGADAADRAFAGLPGE